MAVVFALLILSFLQGALTPLNLVLVFLLVRSFVSDGQGNLWLAFGFGLLLSLLLGYPLGSLSLLYIMAVFLVRLVKKTRLAGIWPALLPLLLVLLFFERLAVKVVAGTGFDWWWVAVEAVLALPVYLLVRLWEERFVVSHEIKLKIGK